MPTTEELRHTLRDLASTARDVPDMPVVRAAGTARPRRSGALLVAAAVVAVLLVVGVVSTGRQGLLGPDPAAGPTRAVPQPPSRVSPPPGPSSAATPGPRPATRPPGPVATPMTPAEITARTTSCLGGAAGLGARRTGQLLVRYAAVQTVPGYPTDGAPRRVLLLEDDGGYFDCSISNGETWVGKGGDEIDTDRSAAGFELPTLSGATQCGPPGTADVVTGSVVLRTTSRARTARVTVHARGGTRTSTVTSRNGHLYATVQVTGKAALAPARVSVELLDAAGARLPIQRYAQSVVQRLEYPLGPCPSTGR